MNVQQPEGDAVELVTVATAPGRRTGTYTDTDRPGDYAVEVVAKIGSKELGRAKARFLVPSQDLELDRPGADRSLLEQLAKITEGAGGEYIPPEQLPSTVRSFAEARQESKTEIIERRTYWDTWPFLMLFVAVVGVEWFSEKALGDWSSPKARLLVAVDKKFTGMDKRTDGKTGREAGLFQLATSFFYAQIR